MKSKSICNLRLYLSISLTQNLFLQQLCFSLFQTEINRFDAENDVLHVSVHLAHFVFAHWVKKHTWQH